MDLASLLPWRRPKLSPERSREARRTYDDCGNYAAWAAYCRTRLERSAGPGPGPGGSLGRSGVEIVPVLTAADAADVKAAILRRGCCTQPRKKDIDYADVLRFDECSFLLPMLERLLSPEIDARLVAHFRSEYFIYSFSVSRTMPARQSRRSFLWHCDRGPRDFLKLNLFLDPTTEHGSTTEFINRTDSMALERLGYTFGPNRRRVTDLAPLAARAGIALRLIRPDMKAGAALLFEPSNVLHRGILPSHGIRHMVSLMIAPSPIPWQSGWAATVRNRTAEQNQGRWPPDANRLFDMIGVSPPAGGLQRPS